MTSPQNKEIGLHVTRRLNLLSLYRQFANDRLASKGEATGTDTSFASHIQLSPSMWSQIKTHRSIGSRLARQIEAVLALEDGWLDVERDSTPVVTAQQLKFEKLSRQLWAKGTAAQKRAAVTALMGVLAAR